MADHATGDNGNVDAGGDDEDRAVPWTSDPADVSRPGWETSDASAGVDDLSAMYSDDALLDALGAHRGQGEDAGKHDDGSGSDVSRSDVAADASQDADAADMADDELGELLLSWQQEIDSAPMGELVDTDTAVDTINTASAARNRSAKAQKRRVFAPLTVAAAVLAIAFAGTGLAARGAEPGDALWGLTQVLYTDHAHSVQAATSAETSLDAADTALSHHRFDRAKDALESAASKIDEVAQDERQRRRRDEHNELVSQLDDGDSDGAADDPGTSTSTTAGTSGEDSVTSSSDPTSSSEPSQTETSSEPTTSSQPQPPPATSSSESPTTSATSDPSGSETSSDDEARPAGGAVGDGQDSSSTSSP